MLQGTAVFLDIDGTYEGWSPSARQAAAQARAKGHRVFLCTGRSTAMIGGHVTEVGFDGLIASGGGYVELGGQVLQHVNVPVEHLRHDHAAFRAAGGHDMRPCA